MHPTGHGRMTPPASQKKSLNRLLPALAALLLSSLGHIPANADARLAGSVPALARQSQPLGELDPTQTLSLSLALPLRNSAQLDKFIEAVYDPNSPFYQHYLTPVQFAALYGPTQADYDKAAAFATAGGLTVTETYGSRTLLEVQGTVGAIQKAFGIRLMQYQSPDGGRVFYAPDAGPAIPSTLTGVITGVIGLDNADPPHPASRQFFNPRRLLDRYVLPQMPLDGPAPLGLGGPQGPRGGLTPAAIKRAYNLNTLPLDGTGQTMALTEFQPLLKSDVTAYEDLYGLPHIPIEDVAVNGTVYTYVAGRDDDTEAALDAEVLVALAPAATSILIYNGGSFTSNFTKYANDNRAKQLSVSWIGGDNLQAENNALRQVAAQGQSIFCGSGDNGAYNGGTTLSVNNPSSQPFATSVGGTTLNTSSPLGNYVSESVWSGTGGGFDPNWPLPSYQAGIATAGNLASSTQRNLPDISADADPGTGYAVYANNHWLAVGGTSAATPLWAGYTTLVNQQRARNGMTSIGFINPTLYSLYRGSRYAGDFHDITVGDNNFYPATTGYDDSTGIGTPIGDHLIRNLAPFTLTAVTSPAANAAGWNQGAVTVTLAPTDSNAVGHVAAIYYTLDGGPAQTYSTTGVGTATGPFSVTGEGVHALTFWLVDDQGNEETPHQAGTVKIDSVAPTLAFGAATPAPNSAGWNNTPVTVPYTTADATSGVASATPGSPVSITTEGQAQAQTVTVTDVAGNTATFTTGSFSIDLTAPVTTGTESDTTAGATYTLTATDALSGVAATYYTVDGAQSAYTAPFTVSAVGSHAVTFWSVDVAGNVEAAHTLSTGVNPRPYLGALAPSTAQIGGPDLTLKATGSGFLSSSVVQWDGVPLATTYVSPTELDATVPAADTAAVARPSVTVLTPAPGGGVSNALPFTVTDAHIPVTTAAVDGPGDPASGRYRAGVSVTLTATDADGNLAGTFYTLDAAGAKSYTVPFAVAGVGGHTVTYWSTDASGNEEAHHTLTLVIDTAGPATTLTLSGQAVSNGWYKDTVTAALAATDPDGAADVAATYYALDGGARQTYTAPVAVTGEGTHALAYWSVDRAGNEETPHKTATVRIDGVAPALAFGAATPAPNSAGWNNAAVSVPFTTSDATSGVASAVPGSPVKFASEGRSQTASVTVTDVAGNGASFTTPAVSIDLTAPATTGVLGNGQVTLSASDGLSGVAATYYTLDGGSAQAYSAPVTLGEGGHTVTFWSVDVAGNAEGAHTLSTTVAPTGAAVLHTFPAGVQMFSVPRDLSGVPGGMDYAPSPLFVWSPSLTQYVMSAGGSASSLQSGTAYWGRFRQAGRLYDVGKKTDTSKPFSVALKAGWNMVGMPFEEGVSVKTLVVVDGAGVSHDFADAASSGLVSYNLYSYPAGSSAYTVLTAPGGTLDPYLGYWVHASRDVTLLIPPPTSRIPL